MGSRGSILVGSIITYCGSELQPGELHHVITHHTFWRGSAEDSGRNILQLIAGIEAGHHNGFGVLGVQKRRILTRAS